MIANVLAHAIVGIFSIVAAAGLFLSVHQALVLRRDYEQAATYFWQGLGFLAVSLIIAWIWGI